MPSPDAFPLSQIDMWRTPPLNPSYPYSLDLQRSLSGKQLLLNQTPYPLPLIHEHYLNGYISYQKQSPKKKIDIDATGVEVIALLFRFISMQ